MTIRPWCGCAHAWLALARCLPACYQTRPEAFALSAEGRAFLREVQTLWPKTMPVDPGADARLLSARFQGRGERRHSVYLFPDGTYLNVQDDSDKPRLSDRGRWRLDGGLVRLHSDGARTGSRDDDVMALLLVRGDVANPTRLFLVRRGEVGWAWDHGDRGLGIADVALERGESIRAGDASALKRRVLVGTGPMPHLPD
jgi:hypothetical protein